MNEILWEMLSNYGLSEIAGGKHNPQILEFFAEIGFDWVKDDETAWCSAALNFFAKKHGIERSGKLDARSWLKVGELVLEPKLGDIVVFWRESYSSWKGHVGLYVNSNDKYIWCLGGNQGNSISIIAYPRDRLLGYRRLRKIIPAGEQKP
jgi:uncharacterized protein (TIGR02594 family)